MDFRTCLHTCIISFFKILQEYKNGGKERHFIDVYEETHRKKNKDGSRGDWKEFQKKHRRVASNPTYFRGWYHGRTYRTGDLQSSSSPSLFPSSSSTLQTMEVMKKQIMELTQKCAANDAKFAKFDKLEELDKKHMPQVFHDEEDNESDDN
ncbi:hypothetical protein P3S67_027626 [Capsicum chacoense]